MLSEIPDSAEARNLPPSLANVVMIDGPSGSGKNTIVRVLSDALRIAGVDVVGLEEKELDQDTCEFDDVLEHSDSTDIDLTKTFVRHRREYVYPAVAEYAAGHELILLQRGEITTATYQSVSGNVSIQEIYEMHRNAGIPVPGTIIYLGCDPEEALERIRRDKIRKEGVPGSLGGKITGNMDHRRSIHARYRDVVRFYDSTPGVSAAIEVDTTNIPVYEVAERILWYLRESGLVDDDHVARAAEAIATIELIDTVRNVTLIGDRNVFPYRGAQISLVDVPVELPLPSARYVLNANLERISLLEDEFPLYSLSGIVWHRGRPISPPVLERFGDTLVIVDGLHRFWRARTSGRTSVRSIVIDGVREDAPLPVLPIPWNEVKVVPIVPPDKRVYNPSITDHSSYYRDLTPLGSGGERRVMTEFGQEVERKIREIVMEIIGDSRGGFDRPHTDASVKFMKVLLESYPELNARVMITAIYLHDIGYSASETKEWTYGKVVQSKGEHMEDGAAMARQILEGEFSEYFSQKEIEQIVELVRTHDNVETVVKTLSGLVLMEADTLGSFEVAATAPTYNRSELDRYLKKNMKRRVGRFRTHSAIRIAKKLEKDIEKMIESMEK